MSQTHEYSFTKDKSGTIYPMLPVIIIDTITKKGGKYMALVDSGAVACSFPAHIATSTGYDLKSGDEGYNTGIGGTRVPHWKHSFIIKLLSPNRNNILWSSSKSNIGCVDHDNMPIILGTTDFLINFNISLNYKTEKIIVELP